MNEISNKALNILKNPGVIALITSASLIIIALINSSKTSENPPVINNIYYYNYTLPKRDGSTILR
jgi:hypothetical protein